MILSIHPSVLGTKKYLNYDYEKESYSWSENACQTSWIYGDRSVVNSVDIILEILKVPPPSIIPESYKRSLVTLGLNPKKQVPWHSVLPAHRFQAMVGDLVSILCEALQSFVGSGYNETFIGKRSLLTSLSRALVDTNKLGLYMRGETNPTLLSILRSFEYDSAGYAYQTSYNQSSTSTGRLTVDSGPQVLTLPKKYRDILKSRYDKGVIIQIDFTSLEPRLARMLAGHQPAQDVYKEISSNLFDGLLTRDQVKLAVLCALYGASEKKLSQVTKGKINSTYAINQIKEYFGISELSTKLRDAVRANGEMNNFFGRKLFPQKSDSNILVNHYIQSSAVDASLLGFQDLSNKLHTNDIPFESLFIIHDALVIDIKEKDLEKCVSILQAGLDVKSLGNFPVEIDIISTNI